MHVEVYVNFTKVNKNVINVYKRRTQEKCMLNSIIYEKFHSIFLKDMLIYHQLKKYVKKTSKNVSTSTTFSYIIGKKIQN